VIRRAGVYIRKKDGNLPAIHGIREKIVMPRSSVQIIGAFLVVSLVSLLHPAPRAIAASALEIDAKANAALQKFFDQVPTGEELISKAAGALIFPSVVKAGAIIGGEYGQGVLRLDGYTADYYSTISGSIGLQVGVQSKSIIILFMTKDALDGFRDTTGWEVGVDGSVAVVAIGVGGFLDTNTLQEPIIGFIFGQKGIMGNLTLEGTKMSKIIR
jgi:lipid-binding SYLF domain-containing protein